MEFSHPLRSSSILLRMTDRIYIYGKHALKEALIFAPDVLEEVFLAKHFDDTEILDLIRSHSINLSAKMPREVGDGVVHQGIVGMVSLSKLMQDYSEFADQLAVEPSTSLVLLDELQDPQNVGAVIRNASAFGISGVLIPEHNQAQVTGAVVKVSAGMAFKIPLVKIGNINTVIRDLKDRGFAVYGLSANAKYTVTKEEFDMPTLFVLGSEGEGIRQKTFELCDKVLSIPINPKCESLNAAASASIAMYTWSTKHPEALKMNKIK